MTDALIIRPLSDTDQDAFCFRLSAYQAEMTAAAARPDPQAAQRLLSDPVLTVIGGFRGGALVAFAVFFDLPEAISGRRAGQLDDLYVAPEARGHRLAQQMVEAVAAIGRQRGWVHLRWLVPEDNPGARKTYDRFAEAAPWKSYALWLGTEQRW